MIELTHLSIVISKPHKGATVAERLETRPAKLSFTVYWVRSLVVALDFI